MTWTLLAAVALTSLVASWLGVELIRRWASRHLLDHPTERSSHTVPTPRGGGLAIAVAMLAGLCLIQLVVPLFPPAGFAAWVASCALVAAISWLDDLRGVANRWRFLVHLIAALTVVAIFGPWSCIQAGSLRLCSVALGSFLTVFWVAGLINAFNFMDGIDGIAGLQAVIAAAGWILLAHQPATRPVAVLLVGVTAGFLVHNWSPARIFMGDVGSAPLGFLIASIPLIDRGDRTALDWTALLVVWPFLFDSAFTLIRRAIRGENIFRAHRSHLYQRMVMCGLSHAVVTSLYGALAACGVFLAWEVRQQRLSDVGALVAVCLMAGGLWGLTRRVERQSNERAG